MCNLAEKRHFAKKRHLADFLLFQKSVTWQMRQLAEKRHFYKKKNKIWKCEQIFGQMTPFLGRNDAFFLVKKIFLSWTFCKKLNRRGHRFQQLRFRDQTAQKVLFMFKFKMKQIQS